MDFWSRLIAGTSLSSSKSNSTFSDPFKRVARFKREYNQLLQVWRDTTNLAKDTDACDAIVRLLRSLNKTLGDETRVAQPHSCMAFAAESQIYVPVAKIANTSYNEWIIQQTLQLFGTFIESEEEEFVQIGVFSTSLMNFLVRITGINGIRLSLDTEAEVVQLAFNVAAKMRLQPDILHAWFSTDDESEEDEEMGHRERWEGKTSREDFPLFYLLIDYIHHEGRAGDFARTGLLYIIEAASISLSLERWLISSDLATLMATGLGALYSQLSRKLVIEYPTDNFPSILTLSDYTRPKTSHDIVSSTSPDFLGNMDTFLAHLLFWQDVLDHCRSLEVRQTLLEHFQVIFLQQLLYPSLLESSDVDGGSSVAVLTYLRRILESVEHPDLIHLILHYLLALPDASMQSSMLSIESLASKARKRKSINLATMASHHESTPDLFNLVDLILSSLRSANTQTTTVTLQLLSVILRRHHRYAVTTLLRTSRNPSEGPAKTIGVHEAEISYLLTLASSLPDAPQINSDAFDTTFADHIADATSLIESHACNFALLAPSGVEMPVEKAATIPGAPPPVHKHLLRADDPVMRTLVILMEGFLTNSVETNLALTEAVVDLAICGCMDLSGWFLPGAEAYRLPNFEAAETKDGMKGGKKPKEGSTAAEELGQLEKIRQARQQPAASAVEDAAPPLLRTLKKLVDKVEEYRVSIPRFEELLSTRREALRAEEKGGELYDEEWLAMGEDSSNKIVERADRGILQRRISGGISKEAETAENDAVEEREDKAGGVKKEGEKEKDKLALPPKTASVSHVLTNSELLSAFLVEIAAVIQVRASQLQETCYQAKIEAVSAIIEATEELLNLPLAMATEELTKARKECLAMIAIASDDDLVWEGERLLFIFGDDEWEDLHVMPITTRSKSGSTELPQPPSSAAPVKRSQVLRARRPYIFRGG